MTKTKLDLVPETETPIQIKKPSKFDLNKFMSKTEPTVANVAPDVEPLRVMRIADAKDFVRLHPDEAYWTPELCFVNVPVKGEKRETLHVIDEDLAMRWLESAKIIRQRLALASKPQDIFFLCIIPTRNPDNSWNKSAIEACTRAKTLWVQATSRRAEGGDQYKVKPALDADAFPEPAWPKKTMNEILEVSFGADRVIEDEDHPGLRRLTGRKVQLR